MLRLVLGIFLLSKVSFAIDQCGYSTDDTKYRDLYWEKAADYIVNSLYADVHGILCVGIDSSYKKIERVHYRDDYGVKVYKSAWDLKQNDIPFLRQSDFPLAARIVTRSTDPLTIKIEKEYSEQDGNRYQLSIKFLRNVGKGFSRSDIRELNAHFDIAGNKTLLTYNGARIDTFAINISKTLILDRIYLHDSGQVVETLETYRLSRGQRN